MGNSSGVIIPKPILAQLGLAPGAEVELRLEAGSLVITPAPAPARAGWDTAAAAIAAAGEDDPAWEEFGNADDTELRW